MSEDQAKPQIDAGDAADVKRRRRRASYLRQRELDDISWVMGDARGRRVMNRIWELACMWQVSPNIDSPLRTAFHEGGRNLGLALLSDVNEACPEQFLAAMAEAKRTEKEDSADA